MSIDPRDPKFNWVEARAACSPMDVFLRLRAGAERDIETRNEQLRGNHERFVIVSLGQSKFAVRREGNDASIATPLPYSSGKVTSDVVLSMPGIERILSLRIGGTSLRESTSISMTMS